MNSFLLSLTAFLILVLGAAFAVPYFVDWNDYRPVFEAQAGKLLGRAVKVGGDVHLVILPTPEFRFDDIKVADASGGFAHPFLEAKSLQAKLNIGALLSGTVEAREIGVSDPVLRLAVNADGTGNWRDIGRPGTAATVVPRDVSLDALSVTGGRIELARAGTPLLVLDDVDGEASAASLAGPYKVETNYRYEGRTQELRFSTSPRDAQGKFRLKAALSDSDRKLTWLLDGDVSGLGDVPSYDGNLVVRNATADAAGAQASDQGQSAAPPGTAAAPAEHSSGEAALPEPATSGYELKGELHATPAKVELPDFDLTLYAKSHPQMLKGKLTLDLGEKRKAEAALSAHYLDADALLAASGENSGSPAQIFGAVAGDALGRASGFGDATLALAVEQLSLDGDLIGNVDLSLASQDGAIKLTRLAADLPGSNHLDASGEIKTGQGAASFAGPIKLQGSGLRTLIRWLDGASDLSAQTSLGAFTLAADASVGGDEIRLDHASGELSGTKFSGSLRYRDGAPRLIDLALDSDHIDLHDVLGDDASLSALLPSSGSQTNGDDQASKSVLAKFAQDELNVALRIGELAVPGLPPGKLDAKFSLAKDVLDIASLNFAAQGALSLSGKGHIERLSTAPSGQADFALQAMNGDSLKTAAAFLGLPEGVSQSGGLQALAPLDVHARLIAARDNKASKGSLDIYGKAAGGDLKLKASASGDPAKLAEAAIDLDGSMTGGHPELLLALLAPGLPQLGQGAAASAQGKLTLTAHGVPKTGLTGKLALDTGALKLGFDGQGSLKDDGVAFSGASSVSSANTGIALELLGLAASPAAAASPLELRAELAKSGPNIEARSITGSIAGVPLQASANISLGGEKPHFSLSGNAASLSLPAVLGPLVAWQRTASTDEVLGSIGAGASDAWPARGFALGPLARADGEIRLTAKTLTLAPPFQLDDASLIATVNNGGLSLTDLKGHLFGGTFAASANIAPRGAGAELAANAKLDGAKLELASKSLFGNVLAKGPFGLSFNVSGEGLSTPGLVSGLGGDGVLTLDAGTLLALAPDPLKRVALDTAKGRKFKDKDQIAALAGALRQQLTKGTYRYAAATLPFEVKSGTVRLKPSTLATKGAATTVSGYVELASLRLDSEWEMHIDGADLPPVSLVLAGPLAVPGQISPAIDTAALESYVTMRGMQENVERLETLDVSGRNPPPPDGNAASSDAAASAKPDGGTNSQPPGRQRSRQKPQGPVKPLDVKPLTPAKPQVTAKQSAPMTAAPSPLKPDAAQGNASRASDLGAPKNGSPVQGASPEQGAAPDTSAASQQPADSASDSAAQSADDASAAVMTPAPAPKPRPRKPASAPDDWKKGISIFGGG